MASVFLTAMARPTINITAFFFLFTISMYHVPPLPLQTYQVTYKVISKHYISPHKWHRKHNCKRKHRNIATSRTFARPSKHSNTALTLLTSPLQRLTTIALQSTG